jgi:hypothetical protein
VRSRRIQARPTRSEPSALNLTFDLERGRIIGHSDETEAESGDDLCADESVHRKQRLGLGEPFPQRRQQLAQLAEQNAVPNAVHLCRR